MKRKQPQTSLEAYDSITNQQLQDIYNKILVALDHLGEATFEEIAAYLKIDRMQVVRRLSEMARIEIDGSPLIYKTTNKKNLGAVCAVLLLFLSYLFHHTLPGELFYLDAWKKQVYIQLFYILRL